MSPVTAGLSSQPHAGGLPGPLIAPDKNFCFLFKRLMRLWCVFFSLFLQRSAASDLAQIRSCSLPRIRDLNIAQPSEIIKLTQMCKISA